MGESLLSRAAAGGVEGQQPPQEVHSSFASIAQVPANTAHLVIDLDTSGRACRFREGGNQGIQGFDQTEEKQEAIEIWQEVADTRIKMGRRRTERTCQKSASRPTDSASITEQQDEFHVRHASIYTTHLTAGTLQCKREQLTPALNVGFSGSPASDHTLE